MLNIVSELRSNPYPGRGIVIGRSQDNSMAYIVYFIMGRSENSRNRIFTKTEDGIRTEAFDPSKMSDPSLIIYHPVRRLGDTTIVTNGDQTDTVRDFLKKGETFEAALRTREFEPDRPNFTPRISGIVKGDGSYSLSILKSADGDPSCCRRFFFEYDKPIAGQGHFIHTYKTDGDPIPSFEGEPDTVEISGSIDEFATNIWENLNEANKVSLYGASIDLKSGAYQELIINKNN
jgi:IMP cyclohydrolase